jgi:hypothetical protein
MGLLALRVVHDGRKHRVVGGEGGFVLLRDR